jgi:hypothetical protein
VEGEEREEGDSEGEARIEERRVPLSEIGGCQGVLWVLGPLKALSEARRSRGRRESRESRESREYKDKKR